MAAIIFDFDGTIADSFDYFVNFLAKEAGKSPLSAADRQQLEGLTLVKAARFMGHGWWRLPLLYLQGLKAIHREAKHVHVFAGMDRAIEKLHAEGHELFIVSSNSEPMIEQFLARHSLSDCFVGLYGRVVVFGKAPILRKLLRQQHLEAKNCIYIGDEPRDVRAARKADIRSVAVTWGYTREATLAAEQPDKIAKTPGDLLRLLEEL